MSNTTANIALNTNTGKWEATYNGEVLMTSSTRGYLAARIVGSNSYSPSKVFTDRGITGFTENDYSVEMKAAAIAGEVFEGMEEPALQFSINERFDFLTDFVRMVGQRQNASALIVGSGGLGKSYLTMKTLNECGLEVLNAAEIPAPVIADQLPEAEGETEEDKIARFEKQRELNKAANAQNKANQAKEAVVLKGYTTAKGLYRFLYENRNRIVVIDDCDTALVNETAVNILKAALDSYSTRVISWNAEAAWGDDLPRSFEFTGGVVFISNMPMNKVPQALISRSLTADVSMTKSEAVERMRTIVTEDGSEFMPEFEMETKMQALDFMAANVSRREIKEVNMRSLMMVVKMIAANGNGWERRALYTLASAC